MFYQQFSLLLPQEIVGSLVYMVLFFPQDFLLPFPKRNNIIIQDDDAAAAAADDVDVQNWDAGNPKDSSQSDRRGVSHLHPGLSISGSFTGVSK